MSDRLLSESELKCYGGGPDLRSQMKALHRHQIKNWKLLRENQSNLSDSIVKEFLINGLKYSAQFTPHRIRSTAANVEKEFIKNRSSFLKEENLPPEQRAIVFADEYYILANPYPIFPMHFTIPTIEQMLQILKGHIRVMLKLCRQLTPDFAVLYNGAECGASAPDHFHFQACPADNLNLYSDFDLLKRSFAKVLFSSGGSGVFSVNDGVRNFFLFESDDEGEGVCLCEKLIEELNLSDSRPEPMFNLLAFYNQGYRIVIFPRSKHRPDVYYSKEPEKMVISPAIVDLCGNIIVPRKEDFDRINEKIISKILGEVLSDEKTFQNICDSVSTWR